MKLPRSILALAKPTRPAPHRTLPAGASTTFYVDVETVSEPNTRGHWAKRSARVRNQRAATNLTMHGASLPALPVEVILTRYGKRKLDDDNLRGALKAVRDQVAAEYGVDDGGDRIVWSYGQDKLGRLAFPAVRIHIQPQRGRE